MLLELEKLSGKLNLLLEEVLRVQVVRRRIARVLLNVKTDSGARRASARETNDNAASRRESGVQALVGGDRAIEISVFEVASLGDSAT